MDKIQYIIVIIWLIGYLGCWWRYKKNDKRYKLGFKPNHMSIKGWIIFGGFSVVMYFCLQLVS